MSSEVVQQLVNDLNNVVDNTTDINDLLILYNEVNNGVHKFTELNDKIKDKVKAYLKERKWERYVDDKSKMSVSITNLSRTTYDETLLKKFLSDVQFAQVAKVSTFERMQIMSPETRDKMNKFLKGKKK